MNEPNTEKLLDCFERMAISVGLQPMGLEKGKELIQHLLFKPQSERGKGAWDSFNRGIITEMELRSFVMEHCLTEISSFNKVSEAEVGDFMTTGLIDLFDDALFERKASAMEVDKRIVERYNFLLEREKS